MIDVGDVVKLSPAGLNIFNWLNKKDRFKILSYKQWYQAERIVDAGVQPDTYFFHEKEIELDGKAVSPDEMPVPETLVDNRSKFKTYLNGYKVIGLQDNKAGVSEECYLTVEDAEKAIIKNGTMGATYFIMQIVACKKIAEITQKVVQDV